MSTRAKAMEFPNTCRLVIERVVVDERTRAEKFWAGLWAGRHQICGYWCIGSEFAVFDMARKFPLNAHIGNPGIDKQQFPAAIYEMRLAPMMTQYRGRWIRKLYLSGGQDIFGLGYDVMRRGLFLHGGSAIRKPGDLVATQDGSTCRLVLIKANVGEVRRGRKRIMRIKIGTSEDVLHIANRIPLTARVKIVSATGTERWQETPLRLVKYRNGKHGLQTPHGADVLTHGFVEAVTHAGQGIAPTQSPASQGPFVRPSWNASTVESAISATRQNPSRAPISVATSRP